MSMKAQLSVPNFMMVIVTLAVFFVFQPMIGTTIGIGNAGVLTTAPDYIISSAIPGIMAMFILLSIIVYGLIRS